MTMLLAFTFFLFALWMLGESRWEWLGAYLTVGVATGGDPVALSIAFAAALWIIPLCRARLLAPLP